MSANVVFLSALFCFFIAEILSYSPRVLRQASMDDDDECHKPLTKMTPGQRFPECCKMFDVSLFNDFTACQNKLPDMHGPHHGGPGAPPPPPPPPPGGPGGPGGSGGPEGPGGPGGQGRPVGPMKGPGPDKGCFWECMFNTSGLLTKDSKINKEAITKRVNNASSSQPDWSSTLTAGTARCFESSIYNETDTHNCKSGATEFHTCFIRQLFLNCPRSAWMSSDECSEIKARAEKCPHMHIPMFIMGKPQVQQTSSKP